jgi:hypothetical protein
MGLRNLVAATFIAGAAFGAAAQDKVAYHDVSDTAAQALGALRNIRNHLDVDPSAKITVLTHAQGVDFLMAGLRLHPAVSRHTFPRNGVPASSTRGAVAPLLCSA